MPTKRKGTDFTRKPRRWTPEADDIVHEWYGLIKPEFIARRLSNRLGVRFTAKAVHDRARDLGIRGADCHGLLTITDAAKLLGVHRTTLFHCIQREGLPTMGSHYYAYLTEDTWRAVQAMYPPPPEPTITPQEAGKRLAFEPCTIRKYIREGRLNAYKVGVLWRVSLADVEAMERARRSP